MSTTIREPATIASLLTFADVQDRLGHVPPERIRVSPPPGTATPEDVLRIKAGSGRLCELVDGILVEKTMGWNEARLTLLLARFLDQFLDPLNLGVLVGADGPIHLSSQIVRMPDLAFYPWDRLPDDGCPPEPIPALIPRLAIEILSVSNSPGEMRIKRSEYFAAGVELVWEIDPRKRIATIYTSPEDFQILTEADSLEGGAILPEFSLPLQKLFAAMHRRS